MAPATKRPRPWDSCDDIKELKRMLEEKEKQLEKATSSEAAAGPTLSPKEIESNAKKVKRSIQQQIAKQMVYKASMKGGAECVSAEVDGVTAEVLKSMLGESLFAKASTGPKRRIQLKAIEADISDLFVVNGAQGPRSAFSKKLRFGATLELSGGLKFVLDQETCELEVTGSYKLSK